MPGILTEACFNKRADARPHDRANRCEFIVGSYYLFESLLVLAGRLGPPRGQRPGLPPPPPPPAPPPDGGEGSTGSRARPWQPRPPDPRLPRRAAAHLAQGARLESDTTRLDAPIAELRERVPRHVRISYSKDHKEVQSMGGQAVLQYQVAFTRDPETASVG